MRVKISDETEDEDESEEKTVVGENNKRTLRSDKQVAALKVKILFVKPKDEYGFNRV